jgi:hypothetical protein
MRIFLVLFVIALAACDERAEVPPADWDAWTASIEARYPVTDLQGHGPDIGGEEWAAALSRKLGIIDSEGHGPTIGSAEWRAAVEQKIQAMGLSK